MRRLWGNDNGQGDVSCLVMVDDKGFHKLRVWLWFTAGQACFPGVVEKRERIYCQQKL